MASFVELVRLLVDGEQVTAGVTNRPTRDLDQSIRYLRERLEAAVRGDTIIARSKLVEADALVGMPVYYNGTAQRYERGLGATEVDTETGAFITSASTQIWGIVLEKHNATSADIVLHGVVDIDLSEAIDDAEIETGLYYLSNRTAGKLTLQRPPVGVTVLQVAGENADGTHTVFVNTKFHDLLESHRHYRFTLQARPAGDHVPTAPGQDQFVTNPDPSIEGWLPASHAVFDGKAPAGAKFGYNLSASVLQPLWPPQPVHGAYLELMPGGDGELLGMGVDEQICIIDRYGIWWMTDSYGAAPWDPSFDSSVSVSESVDLEEYPLALERRMRLWFTRPVFANNATWVSSLQAKEGSGLVITCVDDGEAASTGHLFIDLDLGLTIGETDAEGHIVFKSLENNQFIKGPVLESITAGTDNVTITSDVTITDGKVQGNAVISVAQDLSAGELNIDIARLNGVEEEYFADVIGLGFPAEREASYRGRINIPVGITLPEGTQLKLSFWVLNRSTSPIAADIFSLTYRRIPNPGSTMTDLPLTDDELDLGTIPTADITGTAINQYVVIDAVPFDVEAGDTVLFELTRHGDDDDLNADLHIIRQYGKYVAS